MKTLQSGANKVGTAPRSNQTPCHGRDAAHTGNEAAKLKLYAEISLLKGDIKGLKEAWGVTCFDLYSQGDANGVNASHAKQLVKIREKEAKVQAKIVELNKLKAPKEPVVVDSTPVAVPIAEVPPPTQTMAVPVPPDASAPACDSRDRFVGDEALVPSSPPIRLEGTSIPPARHRRDQRVASRPRDAIDATPSPAQVPGPADRRRAARRQDRPGRRPAERCSRNRVPHPSISVFEILLCYSCASQRLPRPRS